jgi:hypothetical protein
MAHYQPLVARAVANLSTVAARHAMYERLRKAQGAQLGTLRPPLTESEIAREKEALDQAIALIEAQFGGTKGPPLAATTPAARTNAARTEVSIPPLPRLAKADPSCAGSEKSKSWLWLPLAAVLGALLVIAGGAIVMRQKPQYVAMTLPEAQREAAPQQRAKIDQQAQPSPNSTAPAARLPGSRPIAESGSEPANHAAETSFVVPGTARAAVLIASANPRTPVVSIGSAVWSTIPAVPNKSATVAVKADADIPDLKMRATMTLRKNTDPTLQATHTIDLKFSFADGAPITGVKEVEPKMRNLGPTPSEALTGTRVKIAMFIS